MPDLPAMPADERAGESTTNTPLINNPQRGDARNWWQRLLRVFEAAGGRSAILTTDRELQSGPAPLRVPRTLVLSRGLTGPNSDGLPWIGSWAYIPSMDLHRSAGKAVLPARMNDDHVTIPAIYAGNASR